MRSHGAESHGAALGNCPRARGKKGTEGYRAERRPEGNPPYDS